MTSTYLDVLQMDFIQLNRNLIRLWLPYMAISLTEPVGRQQAHTHTPHTDKQIKPDQIGLLENVIWYVVSKTTPTQPHCIHTTKDQNKKYDSIAVKYKGGGGGAVETYSCRHCFEITSGDLTCVYNIQ